MQRCIGVILSPEAGDEYGSLSKTRPPYMLPFGGRYRILDFTLSNMANNDFSNVVLYGGDNMRSTLDHVGNGKSWELNRRRSGLSIFPQKNYSKNGKRNMMEVFYDTIQFYEESQEEFLHFSDPMIIDKEDLTEAYEEFIKNDYDVMLCYLHVKDSIGKYLNEKKLVFNKHGDLINIGTNLGIQEEFFLMTRVGFIKKDTFTGLVKKSIENGDAINLAEAISNNISNLKIGIFEETGVKVSIRNLQDFYIANMNLLNRDIYDALFYQNGVVLTKSKDEPSTLYKDKAVVSNSLIANGCTINGHIENSIIFRGVTVEEGAIVKNSILFQKTRVEKDAVLINSITDKNSVIKSGVSIVGSQSSPYVIQKNLVVEK